MIVDFCEIVDLCDQYLGSSKRRQNTTWLTVYDDNFGWIRRLGQ